MTVIAKAHAIADLRALAARRLPRMVFDYIDGGADDEVTLRWNIERLRAHALNHAILKDVAQIDIAHRIFDRDCAAPFFISPTAASRLFHSDGERAAASAAHKANVLYSLSTIGSVTVEEINRVAPGPKLFQVYVWKDRELVREGLARARAAGFTTLALTVDVPVAGNRERDPRNGFSIPPKVTPKTVGQVLAKPAWLLDLLRTPPIRPANFERVSGHHAGGIIGFIDSQFDRTVTWRDAEWLMAEWRGPVALKGVITPQDARRAAEIGAAVWVSNHGGRQLDRARATIDALPEIVAAVDRRVPIIFDGGVRRGSDIAIALALGADAVAIGRAYLYGLAAGGEAGVARALSILTAELRRTMALLGATKISDLKPDMVIAPRA